MNKFRLLFTPFLLIPLIFIFGCISYAMPKNDIKNLLESTYTFTNGVSEDAINQIYDKWNLNQDYYLITRQGNTTYVNCLICQSYNYGNYLSVSNFYWIDIYLNTGNYSWQNGGNIITNATGFGTAAYTVNLWTDSSIDFSNVNYMPSLPTPTPRVNYVSSWNPVTLINNVINPVIPYQLTYDPATAITGMMYVETYMKFSRPTLINVSLSGVIDTYNEVWSDPIYINTMQSQTLLSDLSSVTTPYILDLQTYNQNWEDFKDSVTVTYNYDDNIPSALRQTYQEVFEKKFNAVGLGGNNFSLYQRYFIIDSNNNVFCGDWFVWNSGRVSKVQSNDVNKDFKPGEEPNGTINVVQPDYVNDTSDNYAPSSGTSTGSDLLTIVNNLVPNYPDYPTAVSYNHDQVLTQFIQTSKQLPGFMGSFGDFLKACFGFIDESVWAVIATGFSCCIVIMIIKVL